MNIDILKRQVFLTRNELKNHQNYLKVKDFVYERGYELIVSDSERPWALGECLSPIELHPMEDVTFDSWCPIMYLPALFCENAQDFHSGKIPYITPNPSRVLYWQQRLAPYRSFVKVGLCWAGACAR